MSTPEIIGATSETKVKRTKTWSRDGGLVTAEEWSGPIAAVEAVFNRYAGKSSGVSTLQFVSAGGKGVCVVTWADEPVASEVPEIWEVRPNEMEVPIEQHSTFDAADREAMALARKEYQAGKECSSEIEVIVLYYNFLANGIDAYLDGGLSISKTVVVSANSTLAASYCGVNRVQSIASIGAPRAIIGALPSGWEWLKKTPTVRQVSRGRYQIAQEWWGAELGWSKILYGGGRTP